MPSNALAVVQTINSDNSQNQTIQGSGNVSVNSSGGTHTIGLTGNLPVANGGTGVGSFSLGSIFFFNGTTFAQDNSNFFWDNTNKRLGIGTSSPTSTLDVNGNINVSGTVTTTNLIPYIGAISDVNLGNNRIYLGTPNGNGFVRGVNASPGQSGSGVVVQGGDGGVGGDASINGGGGGEAGGWGGNVYLKGGEGNSSGNSKGGDIIFYSGFRYGSGDWGKFKFLNYGQTSTFGILDFSTLTGADKTFTFPNASGVIGILPANQTWSGLNKFQSSSNSTIYVGSSSLPGCIALGDTTGSGITYITANGGVLSASSTKPSNCQ